MEKILIVDLTGLSLATKRAIIDEVRAETVARQGGEKFDMEDFASRLKALKEKDTGRHWLLKVDRPVVAIALVMGAICAAAVAAVSLLNAVRDYCTF